jgi:hypothetical protein
MWVIKSFLLISFQLGKVSSQIACNALPTEQIGTMDFQQPFSDAKPSEL